MESRCDLQHRSLDVWDRTLQVNLTAPLMLAREIGLHMSPGGSIVNIASTDAHVGSFRSIAYSASKAALLSVTRSLANVLGPRGIRINADGGYTGVDYFMKKENDSLGRASYPRASTTPWRAPAPVTRAWQDHLRVN